jgi:protein involved in temperature-dependent protein secretion
LESLLVTARAEAAATARLTDPVQASRRRSLIAPPPHAVWYTRAAVCHAQEDNAGVAAALAEAKAVTPATSGTLTWTGGRTARFIDLTDIDDLTGPMLPCYHRDQISDLPYSQLRSVELLEPKTSFDVMWLPADVVPVNDKALLFRVPAYYVGSGTVGMREVRTGEETICEHSRGYARGLGQRDFKVTMENGGPVLVGILNVKRIDFDVRATQPAEPVGGSDLDVKPSFWKRLFG